MKLSDVGQIIGGGTPSTTNPEYWDGDISWITPKDLSNYPKRYISKGIRTITEEGFNSSSTKMLPKNTILFTSRAPIGYIAIAEKDLCTNQGFKSIVCDSKKCHYLYLYYWLKNNIDIIKENANGSTFMEISGTSMKNLEINLPTLDIQKKIAKILSNIDEKIELNNQINDNLQEISKQLYKRWFIDFEFPNEEGNPYKSSGGKMVNSELGEIPEGWIVKNLKEFFPVVTGKKDANASSDSGNYPFFTCSQKVSKIDSFSFDNSAVLLAGNGDFNVKVYRGKFDAYQRTYVLIPYNKEELGFLYHCVKYNLNDITSGHRGSVIKFITKGNIEDFKIAFCLKEELINVFQKTLIKIESINNEIETLTQLRDTLLSKLMNGEIDLENIEI